MSKLVLASENQVCLSFYNERSQGSSTRSVVKRERWNKKKNIPKTACMIRQSWGFLCLVVNLHIDCDIKAVLIDSY